MGCDIHPYFERRGDDGLWHAHPKPKPHPEWWWKSIADEMVKTKAAHLLTFQPDDALAYDAVKAELTALSEDEIMRRFGDHPRIMMDWNIPYEFRRRDYGWFAALANVRSYGNGCIWEPRGCPADLSPELRREVARYGDDGHSHSWLMVSEILAEDRRLSKFTQYGWLRENIPEPDRTRMVFYFDN